MMLASGHAGICQLRFVLWALRSAIAHQRGDDAAELEVSRGFELADVIETSHSFWRFATALSALRWAPTVWHDPRCECMSTEEAIVLRALADTAAELRGDAGRPRQWWSLLLPAEAAERITTAAYAWLHDLDRAGIVLPAAEELSQCIHPIENLLQPAGGELRN